MKAYLQSGLVLELTIEEYKELYLKQNKIEEQSTQKNRKGYRKGKYCSVCGDRLQKGKQKFCSKECNLKKTFEKIRKRRKIEHDEKYQKDCEICGIKFIAKRRNQITCSMKCRKEKYQRRLQQKQTLENKWVDSLSEN